MPRNGSGTYTLPASNPVVAGTTIEASWANNTMSDIATELTGSLSRSGAGGMTGPLRLDAGTASVPGLAWSAETTTGWYRAGTGDIRFAVATVDVLRVQSTGLTLTGTLSVSGAATLSAGTANGVLYLDGSKVATSGSALTFDGSNFTVGASYQAGSYKLASYAASGNQGIDIINGANAAGDFAALRFNQAASAIATIYTNSNNLTINANAGQTAFQIGGAEQMRLTTNGLGIGTASPNARLVVQQANNTGDGIRLFANGSDTQLITRYLTSIDAWQVTASYASTGAYKPITWWTSDLERMRLDASGNLGLGTASPGSKLEVYGGGAGTASNATIGNASTALQVGVDTSNNCQIRTAQNVPIILYTNATNRGQISADGNLVWGTAALATTATAGFPWIPSCAGVPTGAPTAPYTNAAAMVVDTTNNRLYVRVGSTWRYATLT